MNTGIIYNDNLIEIKSGSIILKRYTFPFLKPKEISFDEIEKIEALVPTLMNGKYRHWGSNDFITWFPMDNRRQERDKIFIIHIKNKRRRMGFTAESSEKALEVLNNHVLTSNKLFIEAA
jgi:hypothetical protein